MTALLRVKHPLLPFKIKYVHPSSTMGNLQVLRESLEFLALVECFGLDGLNDVRGKVGDLDVLLEIKFVSKGQVELRFFTDCAFLEVL